MAAFISVGSSDRDQRAGEKDEIGGEACSRLNGVFVLVGSNLCIPVPSSGFVSLGIEMRMFNIATCA